MYVSSQTADRDAPRVTLTVRSKEQDAKPATTNVEILRVPHHEIGYEHTEKLVVFCHGCGRQALHAANIQPPHVRRRLSAANLSHGDCGDGGCPASSYRRKA
eukprot:5352011-Amphidinium_carterae.1